MSSPRLSEPWNEHPLTGELGAETMLSTDEVNYLHWLGRDRYTGAGRVVELGSFLGGSTLALAKGLAQNPAWTKPLLAYDRFIMFEDQENRYGHVGAPGESFLPVFERNTREYAGRITARAMPIPVPEPGIDHTDTLYPEREPVEILFIDAAKSWPVHITILDVFGPHLIPERSILIQQDFKWAAVYYLPLHMYQLRDCLQPLHDIAGAGSTAFACTAPLDTRLPGLWKPEDFTPQSANTVWDEIDSYWLEHVRGDMTHMLRLLRAQHLISLGSFEEGAAVIQSAIAPALRDRSALFLYAAVYATPRLLRQTESSPEAAARLRDCRDAAQQALPSLRQHRVHESLDAVLESIERASKSDHPSVILFGAGKFTRRLLGPGTRNLRFRPLAIVDDHAPLEEIAGVPVVRPEHLAPHAGADLIVISSDAHADALEKRARQTLGDDITIVRFDRPAQTTTAP